jgi:hypothetical protein
LILYIENRNISIKFTFLGLEFFETSAKENINVKAVFERYEKSFFFSFNYSLFLD